MENNQEPTGNDVESPNRRKFLSDAGRFAIATPAAVTLLLSTSLEANAVAYSGGGGTRKKSKKITKVGKFHKKVGKLHKNSGKSHQGSDRAFFANFFRAFSRFFG